jgi:hypothetical protein
MTESDNRIPADPHEGIDAFAGQDARSREENEGSGLSRAASSGPPPTDAPPSGEAPDVQGTGAADPLAGVTMDEADVADAVSGDDGPVRR